METTMKSRLRAMWDNGSLAALAALVTVALLISTLITGSNRPAEDDAALTASEEAFLEFEERLANTVPYGSTGVVYTKDRLIVDFLYEGEYFEPDETGETVLELYEASFGKEWYQTPIGGNVLDGDRTWFHTQDLLINMTDEEAIQYLNGRSPEARMLDLPDRKHDDTLVRTALMDAMDHAVRAIENGTVPAPEWELSGPTMVDANEEIARLFNEHPEAFGFGFDCIWTPITMTNYQAVLDGFTSVMNKDVNFGVMLYETGTMFRDTVEPCYYMGDPADLEPEGKTASWHNVAR